MRRLIKSKTTLSRARRLRAEMSDAERVLWMLLRDRRFSQFKFRRQVPVGDSVADFLCFECKLVVELDGAQHSEEAQAAFDAKRTAVLNEAGLRVVRINVGDLFGDREGAMETIWQALYG